MWQSMQSCPRRTGTDDNRARIECWLLSRGASWRMTRTLAWIHPTSALFHHRIQWREYWCCEDGRQHIWLSSSQERRGRGHLWSRTSVVRLHELRLRANAEVLNSSKAAWRLSFSAFRYPDRESQPDSRRSNTPRACCLLCDIHLSAHTINRSVRCVMTPYMHVCPQVHKASWQRVG